MTDQIPIPNYEELVLYLKEAIKNQEIRNLRRIAITPAIQDLATLEDLIKQTRDLILSENPNIDWEFLLTSTADGSAVTIFKGAPTEVHRMASLVATFLKIQGGESIKVPDITKREHFLLEYLLNMK